MHGVTWAVRTAHAVTVPAARAGPVDLAYLYPSDLAWQFGESGVPGGR